MNNILKKLPLIPNARATVVTGTILAVVMTVAYFGTLIIFN